MRQAPRWFVSLALLSACSSEDASSSTSGGTSADAGTTPGSPCEVTGVIADPLPLKVTVGGSTPQGTQRAVSGAVVELRSFADDAILASGNTGIEGTVELSVASRGAPVLAYVRVTRSGFVTARYAYQTGFAGGLTGAITVFLPLESDLVKQATAAGKTFDPKSGSAVGITAYECASKLRLVGGTFQVSPGGGVVYRNRVGDLDPSLTSSTDVGSGTDFGVPAGRAKVRIARDGRSSELDVSVGAGELFGLIMSL